MLLVLKAIDFATNRHAGQVRKASNVPYITHPVAVSYIVASFKHSRHHEELLTASILHNIRDNPTAKMIRDTRELMAHVEKKRRLSATHKKLVGAIKLSLNDWEMKHAN